MRTKQPVNRAGAQADNANIQPLLRRPFLSDQLSDAAFLGIISPAALGMQAVFLAMQCRIIDKSVAFPFVRFCHTQTAVECPGAGHFTDASAVLRGDGGANGDNGGGRQNGPQDSAAPAKPRDGQCGQDKDRELNRPVGDARNSQNHQGAADRAAHGCRGIEPVGVGVFCLRQPDMAAQHARPSAGQEQPGQQQTSWRNNKMSCDQRDKPASGNEAHRALAIF